MFVTEEAFVVSQIRELSGLAESHYISQSPRKVRRESQVQKRRVAALENYTCQLCGFQCEYLKGNGKKAWIIQVDHIVEKAIKGAEKLTNLWVLCPNCHAKKTYGVITIDFDARRITEGNREIRLLTDNHLFT
jgi:predicted restriction endonuclease